MDRILSKQEVCERTSLSMSAIWRLEKQGRFPRRVAISANRVGWRESEIEAWAESLPVVDLKPGDGE